MADGLHITSEIGRLRTVLLHRPAGELLNLSPDSLSRLLFDDIPFLEEAQREHDVFASMLRDEGVEVLYLNQLVAEAIEAAPQARGQLCRRWLDESGIDGAGVREAVSELLDSIEDPKALVDKLIEGVRADELDLAPTPRTSLADRFLTTKYAASPLVVDPIPNIYFTRDTFSVIGRGVSMNRMLSLTRRCESAFGSVVFEHHPRFAGAPLWYRTDFPYHIEGGDILVLGERTVAVGISERTCAAAVDLLAQGLLWGGPDSGVRAVYAFSIPHKRSFMHLDTVFTQVDVDVFAVHPGILDQLAVFELARGARQGEVLVRALEGDLDKILAQALGLPAVKLVRCGGADPIASAREQWNDGSNTLAVRPGRVFVYKRNSVTNDILAKEGVELLELPSAELSRGRGGPHCMSMAFVRDDL